MALVIWLLDCVALNWTSFDVVKGGSAITLWGLTPEDKGDYVLSKCWDRLKA